LSDQRSINLFPQDYLMPRVVNKVAMKISLSLNKVKRKILTPYLHTEFFIGISSKCCYICAQNSAGYGFMAKYYARSILSFGLDYTPA